MCPDTAPPARARAGRTASCARHCTLWPLPLPHTGEDVHAADRPHTPRNRVRTLPLWPLVSFPTQGSHPEEKPPARKRAWQPHARYYAPLAPPIVHHSAGSIRRLHGDGRVDTASVRPGVPSPITSRHARASSFIGWWAGFGEVSGHRGQRYYAPTASIRWPPDTRAYMH